MWLDYKLLWTATTAIFYTAEKNNVVFSIFISIKVNMSNIRDDCVVLVISIWGMISNLWSNMLLLKVRLEM